MGGLRIHGRKAGWAPGGNSSGRRRRQAPCTHYNTLHTHPALTMFSHWAFVIPVKVNIPIWLTMKLQSLSGFTFTSSSYSDWRTDLWRWGSTKGGRGEGG